MRIVIDANILVSGVFWSGLPGKLIQYWMVGRIELIASVEIVAEYERVMHELAGVRGRPDLARTWVALIAEHVTLIDVEPRLTTCRDPDDNMYLDCAVQGDAMLLVSGDKDLLSLKFVQGIPIVSARQAVVAVEK